MMKKGTFHESIRIISFLLLSVTSALVSAGHVTSPVISIIIDDIGYRNVDDLKALELPGPITYAVMPHAPLSSKISQIIQNSGKSILLHLPMEALDDKKNVYLGPGALKLEMNEVQFISTLSKNLRSIPDAIGVNNHMGSLMTMQTEQMEWLMTYLQLRNIFYVDSMTNNNTVASDIASKKNVPVLRRDVFLDNSRDKKYIESQFKRLVDIAKINGTAIAIGHPHPETIEVLMYSLDNLEEYGVSLIGISEMLSARHNNQIPRLSLYK